jgi:hypothetical protein
MMVGEELETRDWDQIKIIKMKDGLRGEGPGLKEASGGHQRKASSRSTRLPGVVFGAHQMEGRSLPVLAFALGQEWRWEWMLLDGVVWKLGRHEESKTLESRLPRTGLAGPHHPQGSTSVPLAATACETRHRAPVIIMA